MLSAKRKGVNNMEARAFCESCGHEFPESAFFWLDTEMCWDCITLGIAVKQIIQGGK